MFDIDNIQKKDIAVLVFSKDRAMQLGGVVESFFDHCPDGNSAEFCVLYKASDRMHEGQYDRLRERYRDIVFIVEGDFKAQVLAVVKKFKYVLFLVDDNLFVRDICLAEIVKSLEVNGEAIGFSLRLGRNTNYCYSKNTPQVCPEFQSVGGGVLKYRWINASADFGYPLEVSSSVYRTGDITELLEKVEFGNPNFLEDAMASNVHFYTQARSSLLCYENSVTFCNPLNVVQDVWDNRACGLGEYSAGRLAEMFEKGSRIDVARYSGFVPNACHQEVELYFKQQDNVFEGKSSAGERPKFSIVMANYNNGKYIAEAIESVLKQTFGEWELIVVEDCSTDDSLEVIGRFLDDKRVRLVRHEENRGYTAALKTGITEVRSAYFGILDSDDSLVDTAVERMYEYHCRFADCGLIYSQFVFCHEDMRRREIGFCVQIAAGGSSLDTNVVSHFKTFKLADYLKTEGYDENILYAEDVDIIYKMEEVSGLRFVDEPLYLYRELPGSVGHSKEKINVAIMSRVKARINAIKRRCVVDAQSGEAAFGQLFRGAVEKARRDFEDVEQYFVILTKLCQNNLLDVSNFPPEFNGSNLEGKVLWAAANIDIKFDEFFGSLKEKKVVKNQALVTVEMVTYNNERFIREAIDSVLGQSYDKFELLIVDDGSTDRTRQIVASYPDGRIRYIYKANQGPASARNMAIAEAKGEYLLCVDSDDHIAADYLEKMVGFAEGYPDVDYFYPAGLTLIDESGKGLGGEWEYLDFSDNSVLPAFLFGNGFGPIPNPGSLKRRSMFERTGCYEELASVEDFVFLCRNALKINFKRVEAHSRYFYRRLGSSNSLKFEARNQIMADVLNEMVSVYPPDVLYPAIAEVGDPALRGRLFYEYVANTFGKHADNNRSEYGSFFRRYADLYKQKPAGLIESGKLAVST